MNMSILNIHIVSKENKSFHMNSSLSMTTLENFRNKQRTHMKTIRVYTLLIYNTLCGNIAALGLVSLYTYKTCIVIYRQTLYTYKTCIEIYRHTL